MNLGNCEWVPHGEPATGWRYDPDTRLMVPVCEDHRPDYTLAA